MSITALHVLKKIRFTQVKKFIATTSIVLLLFTSYAPPAVVVAKEQGIDLVPIPSPTPEAARPVKKPIEKEYVGVLEQKKVLGLADMAFTEQSARTRLPVEVQEMEQDDFTAEQSVSVTINNPDRDTFTTKVKDAQGNETNAQVSFSDQGRETLIRIDEGNQFTPGKYTVEITDSVGTKSTQDFTWGVLALNTDKSFYRPGEKADIAIGVLDDKGDMVCNAVVELEIINNKTRKSHMITTREGQIQVNKACHSKDFTLTPDYEASYVFGEPGKYTMRLKAQTTKGEYEVYDQIEVKQALPFDIKRTSATRLYPPLEYPMLIEFTAQQDFTGTVTETVPDSFIITPADENKTYDTTKTVYLDKNDPAAEVAKHVLGAQTGGLQMPFDGHFDISQGFGSPMTDASLSNFYAHYGLAGHDGIDFALPMGTPLYAVDDGNVIFSGPGDYGITIILQHSWGRSYYGHLSKTNIDLNSSVKKASLIGYSGNTGESTGPHLHFGIKPENPDVNNGYAGKIDPMPYLSAVNGKDSLIQALSLKNASAVLSATDSAVEAVPTPAGHVLQEQALNQDPAQPTTEPTKPVATPTPAKPEAPSVKAKPFTVTSDNIVAEVADSEGITNEKVKVLQWHVSLKKGEKTTLAYTYEVPKISPQFYLQGTVKVFDSEHKQIFEEGRKWQLAADSVGTDWYDKSWTYRKPITIDSSRVASSIDPWCNDASGITCNTSWTSRKKITFANGRSSTALTNFPVLIKLNSSRIDYADTQADGDDLRFVDPSDNTTVLSHEIEDFDETGDDYIWVEVPQINASSNTDYIWMYYNNASATSGNDTANLWDTNFRTVAHFVESGDGSGYDFNDSSTYGNDYRGGGNVLANTPTRTTGRVGYGQSFDGTNDYMEGFQSAVVDATLAYTVSMWIKIDTCNASTATANLFKQFGTNSIEFSTCFSTDYDLGLWQSSSNAVTSYDYSTRAEQWQHVAVTYNGSGTMTFYVNGFSPELSDATITEVASTGSNVLSTSSTSTPTDFFNGIMDEVRISNTNRSANWIEAEYLTGADKFNTFGPEEDQNVNKSYTDPISSTASWCNIATGTTCNSSWSARRKITLNNNASTTNLTNFPILVVLNSSRIDFSKTQSAGQDLRFVDANGTTLLDYEIEDFNESGNDYIWVEVPQIDANSITDYIWMYYGNGSASAGENPTGVWDSSFEGVWHLDQNGDNVGADYLDSTSNAKHGTGGNGTAGQQPAVSTSGKIGSAQDFTSNTDWITIPSITYANDLSITVWFNGGTQTASQWNYLVYSTGPTMEFGTFSDDLNWKDAVRNVNPANGDLADSTWHMATGVIDGTLMSLYVDGVLDGDLAYPGGINNGAEDFRIGGNGADKGWGGLIDEVRISDAPRSADWIYAEYITMQDQMNTFSSEETQNPGLSGGSGDAWCNDNSGITCTSSWTSRKRLNIINGGTDDTLINYPILVKLDSTRIDYTKVQSDGDDLRFVDPSDNTTVIPHEIEGTFTSGGSNYVWVKVPHIPANSNNDWIWMYYNNAGATSGADATNVWDSNYNITYHMDESAGNISDSAGSAQDAVRNSTTVAVGTGKVGSAQDFSSTGYLTTATPGLPTGDFTYQLWAQYDSTSDENLFAALDGAGGDEARLYAYTSGMDMIIDGVTTVSSGVRTNTTNWFHYNLSRAGSKVTLTRNGIQSPTILTDGDALSFSTCSLIIGADADATCTGTLGNYLDGRIDEFRVSNIARSPEWNEADYDAHNDSKVTFAEEEGGSNLTDFPMLVSLTTDSSLQTKAQISGNDILFTDSTGRTKLSHEIESYNSGTGQLVVWIKIPTLSSASDTDIYMYYGNPAASNQQSVAAVWSNGYHAVYHFGESGTCPTFVDSALGKNASCGGAGSPTAITGKVGSGRDFDGTDDYMTTPTTTTLKNEDSFSIQAWFTKDVLANNLSIYGEPRNSSNAYRVKLGINTSNEVNLGGRPAASESSASFTDWGVNANTISASTWTFGACNYDAAADTSMCMKDNTSQTTSVALDALANTDPFQAPRIGASGSGSEFWNGILDEVRISSVVRTADWFTTEYNNQNSPATFYAVGSEETYIYAPTNDELMRHGKFFDGRAAEQPFAF